MTLPAVKDDVPANIRAMLGLPALLSSEDATIYEETLAHFAREVAPRDLITWMLIKDLADHRLEIARYRRIRAALVRSAFDHRTEMMIAEVQAKYIENAQLMDKMAQQSVAEAEAAGGPNVARRCRKIDREYWDDLDAADARRQKTISDMLAHNPTDREIAAALPRWIEGYQQLDRCLRAAEERFITTLRDIERHVAGFGKTLRCIDVIEGEVLAAEKAV